MRAEALRADQLYRFSIPIVPKLGHSLNTGMDGAVKIQPLSSIVFDTCSRSITRRPRSETGSLGLGMKSWGNS